MSRPSLAPPRSLWILWILLAAGGLYLQLNDPAGDRGIANVFTGMVLIAMLSSAWIFLLFRGGRALRLRLVLATLVLIGLCFGPLRLLNFKGFDGVMIPEFESRFRSPGPALPTELDENLEELAQSSPLDFPHFQAPLSGSPLSEGGLAGDWLEESPSLLWKQPIGLGWGGFAIAGGVALTLEEREGRQALIAYELETGATLWSTTFGEAFTNVLGGPGPRSTPTVAKGLVLAHGPRGMLICVDGKDGSLRWSHDLMAEYGVDQAYEDAHVGFGRANSPLVIENKVILPAGGVEGGKQAGLVAFDLMDGSLLWESPPRQISYATPILGVLGGVEQILITNEDTLSAHDPENGAILWEHSWPGNTPNDANTSQPRILDDARVFLSKGYGQGASVIEVSRVGEHWKVETLWHNKRLLRTKFTSAVIHEGHAYGLSDGILECGDLASGKRVWKGGRYQHGQLMLVDGLLLILSEEGYLALVEATPDKEAHELGRVPALEGKTWNHIALSGDLILVRNADEAALLRWPSKKP